MTLRPLLAGLALLAAPTALAAIPATAQPGSEASTANANPAARTPQVTRKGERARPGMPLKPRVIEAPGAAVMMIPASYDPAQTGPFSAF